jgi:L-2,4-diaminobutyrate decarboxylase
MMQDTQALLEAMFDPEAFRASGHKLIDLLANNLGQQLQAQQPVLQWREPFNEDVRWQEPLPQHSLLDADEFLKVLQADILPGNLAIHHPHNLGHQVATPLPMAALCDLVAALTNQAMAVYETGPSATMLERQVIRWLSTLVGWESNLVNGVLTSGGAQANLTALLAARQHAGQHIWQSGLGDHDKLRILTSEHSHYSIARAAGIMGMGASAVIPIATDAAGRMLLSEITAAHQRCKQAGEKVMAVVANAACTPTGSVDPLLTIGAYCHAHKLWLHIDGAHGASALLSDRYRNTLSGIALADSVVWDGHKLLYMPAAVSAVLFRNPKHSYLAFAQDASYLFSGDQEAVQNYDGSYRTLECTKRMMALKLWTAFKLYGKEGLGKLVETAFDHARTLAKLLDTAPDFEVLMPPQTNIVCFRHLVPNATSDTLNTHQHTLRKRLVTTGTFHLTQVDLHGHRWLRTTLMNPFTSEDHMHTLINSIRSIAEEVS